MNLVRQQYLLRLWHGLVEVRNQVFIPGGLEPGLHRYVPGAGIAASSKKCLTVIFEVIEAKTKDVKEQPVGFAYGTRNMLWNVLETSAIGYRAPVQHHIVMHPEQGEAQGYKVIPAMTVKANQRLAKFRAVMPVGFLEHAVDKERRVANSCNQSIFIRGLECGHMGSIPEGTVERARI